MHAYKHFATDVIAGALAGYLMGELFYSFNNDLNDALATGGGTQQLFTIRYKF